MKQAVCILLRKNGKVLSVARRHDHSLFGLPGGKVDPGETPEEAICRELAEETGLTVKVQDIKPIFEMICKGGPDGVDYNCITYMAKNWTGTIKQGDAGPVKWLNDATLIEGPFGDYNKALFEEEEKIKAIQSKVESTYGKIIEE